MPRRAVHSHFRHLDLRNAVDPAELLDRLQPRPYVLRPVVLRCVPVVEDGCKGVWVKDHCEGAGRRFLIYVMGLSGGLINYITERTFPN